MTRADFEYEIKWSNLSGGMVVTGREQTLRIVNQMLLDSQMGKGTTKITIIQKRVTKEEHNEKMD